MKKFKPFPNHDFKIDCGDDPEVRQWLHENGCRWSSGCTLIDYRIHDKFLTIEEGQYVSYDLNEYKFSLTPEVHFNPYLEVPTTTPRPHAELIKQWADDVDFKVQSLHKLDAYGSWTDDEYPTWLEDFIYREKPKTVTKSLYVRLSNVDSNNITNYSYFTKDEVPEGWLKVEKSEKEFKV